ncbi:MAG: N-acetylmuramidase family protein [Pseudoxanthomonas sp.]
MAKPKLNDADFARGASALEVDVPSIKAVFEVEAPLGGFLDDGQVTILFERHKFSQFTKGRYDRSHPHISNPEPGGYGPAGQHQHDRLAEAVALDRDAALKATSWGKPQIMGFNHALAGFPNLQAFITAMHHSEGAQLDAFVNFIRNQPLLLSALRAKNWSRFAARYNGPAYAKHDYHGRLAKAYRKHGGK